MSRRGAPWYESRMHAPRLRAALYGLLFHVVVAAVAVATQRQVPASFWAVAIPVLLFSSFLVYLLLVGPYLARRKGGRGAVLFDCAVGMLAECVVAIVAAALYGATVAVASGGAGGLAAALGQSMLLAIFFMLATLLTHVLAIGNAAGLIGWVLIEKVLARREAGRAQA